MKFFHLSDLHIGKQLHHYSLREDQKEILGQVTAYARQLHPDAIVIAGDVYDKSVPSAEAVSLWDEFLTSLAEIRPGDTAAAGGGYALVLRLRRTFRIFDFVRIPMGYSSIVCRCFLWFHAVPGRMSFPDEAFSLRPYFYLFFNQSLCGFSSIRFGHPPEASRTG